MAGKQSNEYNTEYLTPFKLIRENINSGNANPYNETTPSTIPETSVIYLGTSGSGHEHNKICLIFKRLSGNKDSFNVKLYCNIKDKSSDLFDQTFLVDEEPNAEEDRIMVFEKLYAGDYKILISDVSGAEYNLYESHFHNSKINDIRINPVV